MMYSISYYSPEIGHFMSGCDNVTRTDKNSAAHIIIRGAQNDDHPGKLAKFSLKQKRNGNKKSWERLHGCTWIYFFFLKNRKWTYYLGGIEIVGWRRDDVGPTASVNLLSRGRGRWRRQRIINAAVLETVLTTNACWWLESQRYSI